MKYEYQLTAKWMRKKCLQFAADQLDKYGAPYVWKENASGKFSIFIPQPKKEMRYTKYLKSERTDL